MDKLSFIQKRNKKRKKDLLYEFMPGLTEIIEKPANRGGYFVIWTICLLILSAIVWASLSKVDVVVSCDGIVYPDGNVKVVHSVIAGNISKINVKDGEEVSEGDTLVEVDLENIKSQLKQQENSININQAEYDIYGALIDGKNIEDIDISKYKGDAKAYAQYIVSNEKKSLKIINKYKKLGYGFETYEKEYYEQLLDVYSNVSRELKSQKEELNQNKQLVENGKIKATSNGVVSGVSALSKSNIVTAGQEVAEIVPNSDKFVIEAAISSSDISDIKVNSSVNIKLSAYSYGDYGMIKGKITYISPTSKNVENIGMVYPIKIELDKPDNKEIQLKSGMTANVEVCIGKRRIIEYILEPIFDAFYKSAKEK